MDQVMSFLTDAHALVDSYGTSGYLAAGLAILLTFNLMRSIIYYNPKVSVQLKRTKRKRKTIRKITLQLGVSLLHCSR